MPAASQQFVKAPDGARLAVSTWGSGPVLLMIPGLGATRRVYQDVVPALTESLTVVVYDPRGTGESELTDGPYTMAQLAADAAAVVEATARGPVAVWGASMGGMVAMHLALDHPEAVRRLVLACTGPGGAAAVRSDPEATRRLLGKGARTPGEAYRLACTVLYHPAFQREHAEVIEREVSLRERNPISARAFSAQFEAVRHHDVAERLRSLHVPTLVVHGEDDAVMPVGNGRAVASLIPGARLVVLPGRGHMFFAEAPRETAALVTDFVGGA